MSHVSCVARAVSVWDNARFVSRQAVTGSVSRKRAPVAAFSAWLQRDEGFNALFRFVIMPLFLFSGAFFPVTRLPQGVREIAYATPLWHGVDLIRHLTLGTAALWPSLGHVAYLALWVAVGLFFARRTFTRKLVL